MVFIYNDFINRKWVECRYNVFNIFIIIVKRKFLVVFIDCEIFSNINIYSKYVYIELISFFFYVKEYLLKIINKILM